MRSEEEVKEMARHLINQINEVKDKNLTAYKYLSQRLMALVWVLNLGKVETLILNEKQLEFLSVFW